MRRAAVWVATAILIGFFAPIRVLADEQTQCLEYADRYTDRISINLATGIKQGGKAGDAIETAVKGSATPPLILTSPDQKQTAIQYTTPDGAITFGLLPAYTVNAQLNTANDANDGLRHVDVTWSPDSQWLSYLTFHEDDGYYLSLMDADGHLQQTRLISTRFEDSVTLFGWSGDGRYLAVSVSDSMGGPLRKIEIRSAPTLELKQLIKPAFSIGGPYLFGAGEDFDYPNRIQWSSQGSILAYLDYHDDGLSEGLTLNIYTPDDDKTITYELPDIRSPYGVGMRWSPDGQALAVATTFDTDEFVGRIAVVSVNEKSLHTVSEKVLHNLILAGGGYGFPFMQWSPNGHNLLFIEQLPTQSHDLGALKAYIPATTRIIEISPHIYMNPHTDGTGRYLFARSPNDGQDYNRGVNPGAAEQTPSTEDTVIVIDTHTLKVVSVPALQPAPYLFQVYGIYSDLSGWLLLSEDDLTTWAINMKTGAQVALYAPHNLYKHTDMPFYFPIQDADFVARLDFRSGKVSTIAIRSLLDDSTRTIKHSVVWPLYHLTLSSDENLLAIYGYNSQGNASIEIIKSDGTLLWKFDEIGFDAHNFVFSACE
jgi:WD40 repeat protein